jgi:hypothetical protein
MPLQPEAQLPPGTLRAPGPHRCRPVPGKLGPFQASWKCRLALALAATCLSSPSGCHWQWHVQFLSGPPGLSLAVYPQHELNGLICPQEREQRRTVQNCRELLYDLRARHKMPVSESLGVAGLQPRHSSSSGVLTKSLANYSVLGTTTFLFAKGFRIARLSRTTFPLHSLKSIAPWSEWCNRLPSACRQHRPLPCDSR